MARNRKMNRLKAKQSNDLVERVASEQPRFQEKEDDKKNDAHWLTRRFFKLIEDAEVTLPQYASDTRERDKALLRLVRSQDVLAGILSSVVARDQNRSWTLTGGVRQVMTYGNHLHSTNSGEGWRNFVSLNAMNYYATDFGFISEIGVDNRGVPAALWHVDSTKVKRTGAVNRPFIYFPETRIGFNANNIYFKRNEVIAANSMPAPEEDMNFAGFCAVERALHSIRLFMGIFRHSLEKLGFAPPKGILLGKGIRRKDLSDAYNQYDADREQQDIEFYEGVLSIFTTNHQASIDLVSLSELPDNFQLSEWVDILTQIIALAFNYPVSEFINLISGGGTWGRAGENNLQFEQAVQKGENSFALALQEQLQEYFFPETVSFEFDYRSEGIDLVVAEAKRESARMVSELYRAGLKEGAPLIDRDMALNLLINEGVIPESLLSDNDKTAETDLKQLRERALDNGYVFRIAEITPNEPIIEYTYNPVHQLNYSRGTSTDPIVRQIINQYPHIPGQYRVLWESADDVYRKRIF